MLAVNVADQPWIVDIGRCMGKIGGSISAEAGDSRLPRWTLPVALCVCVVFLAACYMGGSSSHTMAAPCVVHAAPSVKHTGTVIFLHGLGDTGHGWSQALDLIRAAHIKYVCPTAPTIPVTLNGGMRMPSWFDIRGLDPGSDQDEAGIKEASNRLQQYISEEEKKGIPRDRIVVGGFSQGGALALYSALTTPKPPLAGIIGLSTWLPLHKEFPGVVKANQNTSILQCHGQSDPLVQVTFGTLTAELLKTINSNHTFKTYPQMGHSSCDEEMKDVKAFLEKCLPPV